MDEETINEITASIKKYFFINAWKMNEKKINFDGRHKKDVRNIFTGVNKNKSATVGGHKYFVTKDISSIRSIIERNLPTRYNSNALNLDHPMMYGYIKRKLQQLVAHGKIRVYVNSIQALKDSIGGYADEAIKSFFFSKALLHKSSIGRVYPYPRGSYGIGV